MTDTTSNDEAARLGHHLSRARLASCLPPEAVAAVLDIPNSGLADIEAGRRKCEAIELKKLAELYEVTVESILYGEDVPSAEPWEPGAVYRDAAWHKLPERLLKVIDENDDLAYGVNDDSVLDVGDADVGYASVPRLFVYQRGRAPEVAELPLFEVNLIGGPMHLKVYAAQHRDLFAVLRELSPILRDLSSVDLGAMITTRDSWGLARVARTFREVMTGVPDPGLMGGPRKV